MRGANPFAHTSDKEKPMIHARTPLLSLLVALALAGCAGSPTQSSTGEWIDDAWITTQVKSSLIGDAGTSGVKIGVDTLRGEVRLTGFATKAEADRAVQLARRVKGVKDVRNGIAIK
jgi:osmotically-inducible protein OsmY